MGAPNKEPAAGMVEKRGHALWLTHVFMILGVLIVFFPIWLAFVASTVTQADIVSPPMPLLPGEHFLDNYKRALLSGVNHAVELTDYGDGYRHRENYHFSVVGVCHCLFSLSWQDRFFLAYFYHPDVTG